MLKEHDTVVIIDAGSQYCKLIDRIIGELNVRADVVGLNVKSQEIIDKNYKAIIISGGPMSIVEDEEFEEISFDETILDIGIPVLGICFGMQLLVKIHGGKVVKGSSLDAAETTITITKPCLLYDGLERTQSVLMTHSDCCLDVSKFFDINATTSTGVLASISNDEIKIYGTQFHPEVNLTNNGIEIFKNFLFKISKCKPTYSQQCKLQISQNIIKSIPKESVVVVLVSGGVDSTVCAFLVKKLIKNDVLYMMIDNGLLRINEASLVKESLASIGIDVTIIEASEIFMNSSTFVPIHPQSNFKTEIGTLRLQCLSENKRMIIGDTFIKVVQHSINKLGLDFNSCVLVQGTLRPDMIESGSPFVSKIAHVIKTHHNDTELVRYLRNKGQIVEPLIDLHKDEVKKFAKMIKIPDIFMNRKPFPGPGLAVRIICGDRPKSITLDNMFDIPILAEIIANYFQKSTVSSGPVYRFIRESLSSYEYEQLLEATNVSYSYSATLIPIFSVGVHGDCRTYKNAIGLSSNSSYIDWDKIAFIAKIIPKICTSINRVSYVFGSAISSPIQNITLTFISPESLHMSKKAHSIVDNILKKYEIQNISQFPVVLIPIHFDLSQNSSMPPMRRSFVLRPFITKDFMTGVPALPNKDIPENIIFKIMYKLLKIPMVSRILYDLTPKPPGTTEWE